MYWTSSGHTRPIRKHSDTIGSLVTNNDGRKFKRTLSCWAEICRVEECGCYAKIHGCCAKHANESTLTSLPQFIRNRRLPGPKQNIQKGTVKVLENGIEKKFDGKRWSLMCQVDNCPMMSESGSGKCRRHLRDPTCPVKLHRNDATPRTYYECYVCHAKVAKNITRLKMHIKA